MEPFQPIWNSQPSVRIRPTFCIGALSPRTAGRATLCDRMSLVSRRNHSKAPVSRLPKRAKSRPAFVVVMVSQVKLSLTMPGIPMTVT